MDFLYPILTKQIAHRAERQVQDMYNNNFTEEPIVIGIDHGFSLIKTRNHIFSNGVSRCNAAIIHLRHRAGASFWTNLLAVARIEIAIVA